MAKRAPSGPDVFLSYAGEDEARARELATALEQGGFSVFWDREIPPGETWHSYIGEALVNARCVVVAWSRHSIASPWVLEEASEGRDRRVLVPVLFEAVQPPFGFRAIQAANLVEWRPGRSSPAFDGLLRAVQRIVGGQAGSGTEPEAELSAIRRAPHPSASRASHAKPVPPETNIGKLVFNPAERMKVGRRERIEVRLSRDLAAKLTEGLRGRGAPRIEAIEIADRMRVRLLGEDFEIKALSSEDQFVREVGVAQWDFDVVPIRSGRRVLRLLVTLRLKREDTQELYDLPALEREIVVQVAPVHALAIFTRNHWQWLLASIFIPVTVWLASDVANFTSHFTRLVEPPLPEPVAEAEPSAPKARPSEPKVEAEVRPATPAPSANGETREQMRDCPECPEMVLVPAGEFTMGSPPDEPDRSDDEGPQRKVTIAEPFWVGRYEVTFAEWGACVAAGGCSTKPDDPRWGRDNRPVINVSWHDAKEYVGWLSQKTGKTYRLLSEAEWEYAARAGSATAFWWGQDVGKGNANCDGCGSQWDNSKSAPVGSLKANDFGLDDTAGNVWEWVEDCWHDSYRGALTDGSVWAKGDCSTRVRRGGSWYDAPGGVRSAYRYGYDPDGRSIRFGFRVARAPV